MVAGIGIVLLSLAAACMAWVGPFASLGQALFAFCAILPGALRVSAESTVAAWNWGSMTAPFMSKPAWFMLGLPGLCLTMAGLSLRRTH